MNPQYDYRLVPLAVILWLTEWIITENSMTYLVKIVLLIIFLIVFLLFYFISSIPLNHHMTQQLRFIPQCKLQARKCRDIFRHCTYTWKELRLTQKYTESGYIYAMKYIQNILKAYRPISPFFGIIFILTGLCAICAFHAVRDNTETVVLPQEKSQMWIAEMQDDEFSMKRPGSRALHVEVHPVISNYQQKTSPQSIKNPLEMRETDFIIADQSYSALVEIPHGVSIPQRGSLIGFTGKAKILSDHKTLRINLSGPFTVMKSPPWYARLTNWCRTRFHQALRGLNPIAHAIIPALVIGDARMITPELKAQFLAAGILHAMVFSGANFAMILLIFHIILQKIIPNLWIQRIVNLILICLIVIMVGSSPAILRAAIMSAVSSLIRLGNRIKAQANIISATVMVLVILWPRNTHDIGFILSIVSVCAIIFLSSHCENQIKRHIYKLISKIAAERYSTISRISRSYIVQERLSKTKNNMEQNHLISHIIFPQRIRSISRAIAMSLKKYLICSMSIALICTLSTSFIVIFLHGNIGIGTVMTNVIAEPLLLAITILGQVILLLSLVALPLAQLLAPILGCCALILHRIVLCSAYVQTDSSFAVIFDFPVIAVYTIVMLYKRLRRIFQTKYPE